MVKDQISGCKVKEKGLGKFLKMYYQKIQEVGLVYQAD
jgi:hypothetical protein